jgi:hypothetical protein
MYLRDDPTNPRNMDDAERLEEVASIFARGVLRLHGRRTRHPCADRNPPESSPTSLDLSAASRPDRPAG